MSPNSILANASNLVIQGGTFTNVQGQGSELNGLDIFIRHVSPDALPDALEQSNRQCHPNTRLAVLKDILSWVEDDKSETQVLWLHGPAGAGKTAIGHSVAEQAKQQFAAGFFFSRTEAGRNHDKCLIATISYQLLASIPGARPFIVTAVTKDPLIFLRSLNSQIKHLIIEPLNQMHAESHHPHPKLLLIDGLDECFPTGSQKNILTAIHTALQQGHFPFRVLICSRAEPDIREVFESELSKLTYRISLDDKKYEPDQDIALYLRSKFSDIGRKLRYKRGVMSSSPLPSWPSEKVIQTLVSKASGQFIYAATVIRYIDVHDERPDDRLKIVLGLSGSQSSKPFDELDRFYRKIFSAIKDIHVSLTSRLLGTILTLKTPLSIDSLENLLGLREGDAEPALCYLHSVVRLPDSNTEGPHTGVGLYHASLGDFLFDSDRAGVYHIKMESAHATLTESCLRILSDKLIPSWTTSIRRDMIMMGLRENPAAEYAWNHWIYHFLNISSWNDKVVHEFRRLPPWFLKVWLNPNSINEPLMDIRSTIDQFYKLKQWFIDQNADHRREGVILGALCGKILELHFKDAWVQILRDSPRNVSLSLGILAVVLRPGSISSAALATLFKRNWVGLTQATVLIRPYIHFGTSANVTCDALKDFISNPEHFEFTPNKHTHADLVIRCVECMSSHPPQDKQTWQLDPEGAYGYSMANWKYHLQQANPGHLLDYASEVTNRLGHRPMCTHENPCDTLCKVDKTARWIQSAIIVTTFFPHLASTSDIKLLKLLKDIIVIKYLDTASFSEVHSRFKEWSAKYRLAISQIQVRLGSSSAIKDTSLSEMISSLTESYSSMVYQDYQHVSSSRTEVHLDSSNTIRSTGVSKIVTSLTTSDSSATHKGNQRTLLSRTSRIDLISSSNTRGTGPSETISSLGASSSSVVHQDNQHALSLRTSQVDLGSSNTTSGTGPSEVVSSSAANNSLTIHQDNRHPLSSQTSQVDLGSSRGTGRSEIVSSSGASNLLVVDQDNQRALSSRSSRDDLRDDSSRGTGRSEVVSSLVHRDNQSSQTSRVDLRPFSDTGPSEITSSLRARNSSRVRQDNQHTSSPRTSQIGLDTSGAIRGTGLSEVVSSVGTSNSLIVHQDNQSSRTSQADLDSATGDCDVVLFLRASNSSAVRPDTQLSSRTQIDLDFSSAIKGSSVFEIISSLTVSNSSAVHQDNHTLSSRTSEVDLVSSSTTRDTDHSEITSSPGVSDSSAVRQDNQLSQTSEVDLGPFGATRRTDFSNIVSSLGPSNSSDQSSRISEVHLGPSSVTRGMGPSEKFSSPVGARNSSTIHQDNPHGLSLQTSQADLGSIASRVTGFSEVVSSVEASTSSVVHQDNQSSRTSQVEPDPPSATRDSEVVLFLRANHSSTARQDNQHASSSRTSQHDLSSSGAIRGTDRSETVPSSGASNSSAVHPDTQHTLSSSRTQVDLDSPSAIKGSSDSETISSSTASNSPAVHQDNQHTLSSRTSEVDLVSTRDTDHSEITSSLGASYSSAVRQDNQYASFSQTSEVDPGPFGATRHTDISDIVSSSGPSKSSDNQSSRISEVHLGPSNVTRGTAPSEIVSSLGASNSSTVHQDNPRALLSQTSQVSSTTTRETDRCDVVLFLRASKSSSVGQQHNQHTSSSPSSQVDLGSSSAIRGTGPSKTASSSGADNSSVVSQDNRYVLSSRPSQVDLISSRVTKDRRRSEIVLFTRANHSSVVHRDKRALSDLSSSSATRETDRSQMVSSLGTSNPSAVHQNNQSSRVDLDSFTAIRVPRLSENVSFSKASNSLIVYRNYQYALSLWMDHLRHVDPSSILESPACTCHSELVSVPGGVPRLTSDGYARLVIRVIECIAAHHPIDSHSQRERQQTLDFETEGEYGYALFQWKNHLHHANPLRLLNYAYAINVRSGHEPICAHKNECHLLCNVNKITRCIESRIIDAEFFPHTLSVAETKTLKLLREIIDVKYLHTPLFTRSGISSRIQSWSADYRLAIAKTLIFKSKEAGPSNAGVGKFRVAL